MKIFLVLSVTLGFLSGLLACREKSSPNARSELSETVPKIHHAGVAHNPAHTSAPDKEGDFARLDRKVTEFQLDKNVSYAEACNELSIQLCEVEIPEQRNRVRSQFFRLVLSKPENLASVMGTLPAGDLRRSFVASINPKNTSMTTLKDIYQQMPESSDRNRIIQKIGEQSFTNGGVRYAISEVDKLDSKSDRIIGIDSIAGLVVGRILLKEREVNDQETAEIVEYAKGLGAKAASRLKERIANVIANRKGDSSQ